jgi:hypothetical protein
VRKVLGYDKKLPHLKTMPVNQGRIKEKGISTWLTEQQKQWCCPDCQTEFAWYQTECAACGKAVKLEEGMGHEN